MKANHLVRTIALLLAAFVAVMGGASAQDVPARGSFTGAVDAFNASVLVASGVVFDISTAAADEGFTLRTGVPVEVAFTISRGVLTATALSNPSGGTPGTGRLAGAVELASEATFVINGLSFGAAGLTIDDDTVFKTGALVEIDFGVTSGAFTILEIQPYDDQAGIMIGRVDLIEIPRLEVGTVAFDITEAVVNDDPYALEPAALVKVEFTVPPAGIARASSVDVREPALTAGQTDDFNRAIIAGRVTSRDDDSITIAGIEIGLDDTVRVDDDVQVGEQARITFRPTEGSDVLRPTRVRSVDDLDDVDDILEARGSGDDDDDNGDDDLDVDRDDDVDDSDDDVDASDDDSDSDDDDDDGCRRPDGWTTYRVRSGDTLSRIAGASGATVQALVDANCLSSANLIRVGQNVFVPQAIGSPSNSGSGSSDDDDADDDADDDDDGSSSGGSSSSDDDDDGGSSGGGSSSSDDDDGGGDDDDD